MPRYTFREAPLALKNVRDADPQRVGEALEKIAAENGGDLTPGAVVAAARAPRHTLHRFFEWDDRAAADAHRLNQARAVIRSIRVEDAVSEPVQAFISISDREGVSYRAVADVMNSADLQRRVLVAAERDLAAFEARYRSLASVCEIVRQARAALNERIARAETRPQ